MGKTIEQKVAELTPEQIQRMKSVHKKYLFWNILITCVWVIAAILSFMYFLEEQKEAKFLYEQLGGYALFDKYLDLKTTKWFSLTICAGIGLVCLCVMFIVFKIKYPFYSERKYKALKRLKRI